MDRLLHVVMALSILLMILVLASLRRAHIRVEYSVSWLGAAIALFILSLVHAPLVWLAGFLGLHDVPLALILLVFCVFLVVFYRFSVIISDLKDANIALTQRLAIVEFQLQSAHEERQS